MAAQYFALGWLKQSCRLLKPGNPLESKSTQMKTPKALRSGRCGPYSRICMLGGFATVGTTYLCLLNLFYAAEFIRYSIHQDVNLAGQSKLVRMTQYSSTLKPPSFLSRFDIPWNATPRVRLLPFRESGHRILLSMISSTGTDGLGHMMAVLNAEIRTALLLGLTYTHRVSSYGLLTEDSPRRIEDLFGWGGGEISRNSVYREICGEKIEERRPFTWRNQQINGRKGLKRPCLQCKKLAKGGALGSKVRSSGLQGLEINSIVDVPREASFNWCNPSIDPNLSSQQCAAVRNFTESHQRKNHTLFQMGSEVCDLVPTSSDFRLTRGWFYWKYWGRHGGRIRPYDEEGKRRKNGNISSRNLRFRDDELVIAVHIRRGDFLLAQNSARKAISCAAFARAVAGVLEIVRSVGGPFSRLRPHVYIYSEGQRMMGATGVVGHNLKKMNKNFVDENGVVRDGYWMQNLIVNSSSDAMLNPPLVTMRISTDTVEAVHEMSSADWFLGSMSGLSMHVVGSIGRGVILLPNSQCAEAVHLWKCFHPDTGVVLRHRLRELWASYSRSFGEYISTQR